MLLESSEDEFDNSPFGEWPDDDHVPDIDEGLTLLQDIVLYNTNNTFKLIIIL